MKPLVHLFDKALPASQFTTLARRVRNLGTERLRSSYQTTFWFDLGSTPASLVDEAALSLVRYVPLKARRAVIGVEWWLSRMRTSNVKVDFHRDRDNAYFARTGRERNPVLSSLLYLNTCQGGLLAVTTEPPNDRNPALAPDRHEFDFVEPKPNRFAWFDAQLTHGVLDARNQIPGQRLPTEPDWRLAIAINFWALRPEAVPTFADGDAYRSLAI